MLRTTLCVGIGLVFGWPADGGAAGSEAPKDLTPHVLQSRQCPLGLAVEVGCEDGQLMADLAASGKFLVHGLAPSEAALKKSQADLWARGVYGAASVQRWDAATLPYADNLVNVVICRSAQGTDVPMGELLRVLCPGGVAFVEGSGPQAGAAGAAEELEETLKRMGVPAAEKVAGGRWVAFRKPRPKEMGEWTHRYHDAGASCVSEDQAIPPVAGELRWLAGPAWPIWPGSAPYQWRGNMRGMGCSGGRNFYLSFVDSENYFRKGAVGSKQDKGDAPPSGVFHLIARDAFNGLKSWSRSLLDYAADLGTVEAAGSPGTQEHYDMAVKMGETMVTVGGRIYGVLAGSAVGIDAVTGELKTVFEKGTFPRKLLVDRDVLVLAGGDSVRGYDPAAGKPLWKAAAKIEEINDYRSFISAVIVAGEGLVHYVAQGSGAVVALDLRTGEKKWQSQPASPAASPKRKMLFCKDGFVVVAYGTRGKDFNMHGIHVLSAKDGKVLWTRPGGCRFPGVVLAGGELLVPGGPAAEKRTRVEVLDPLTGQARRHFDARLQGSGVCRYGRSGGTERYLVNSSSLTDIRDGKEYKFSTFRSECANGSRVANGLVYGTPYGCNCCRAGVRGYLAYGPSAEPKAAPASKTQAAGRLQPGPAFGKAAPAAKPQPDWPTYRGDPRRTGATTASVPADLKPVWTTAVDEQAPPARQLAHEWMVNWIGGDRLTAPTAAEGLVFVGGVDSHRVTALEAETGKVRWTFLAGGRLDTPPTIHAGLCLFGSYDGWIYCLRAADGEVVWRFRAGPEDRRIVAFGQLESPWPVIGGVLVEKGVAHAAAGRGTGGERDGGIYAYELDPPTGKVLAESYRKDYAVIPDLLVSDGARVERANRGKGGLSQTGRWHLQGFGDELIIRALDRTWHRMCDNPKRMEGSEREPSMQSLGGIHGHLVVGREDSQTAFATINKSGCLVAWSGRPAPAAGAAPDLVRYRFGAADNARQKDWYQDRRVRGKMHYQWHHVFPHAQIEAMALAGDVLVAGGPADRFERDKQGRLWVFSMDGKVLGEVPLASRPVSDGLAAADGRLYVATNDGKVVCLGRQ